MKKGRVRLTTDNVLQILEVVACSEFIPELVNADELSRVAPDRVAHREDMEVLVDADWPRASERAI